MKFVKSNHGRIVLAGLIDAALIIGFFVFLFASFKPPLIITSYPNMSFFIGFILYRFLTILIFNSTLGMRVLKLIFLNANEENLDFKEKFLASIFILYKGVDYYHEVRAYG